MYAKINWEKQTVEFISDVAAEKLSHSPLAVYYVNPDFLGEIPDDEAFDTVREVIDHIFENYYDAAAEMMVESDWMEEYHKEWFYDAPEGLLDCIDDVIDYHLDWLRDYIVANVNDFVMSSYADCPYELVKVPE